MNILISNLPVNLPRYGDVFANYTFPFENLGDMFAVFLQYAFAIAGFVLLGLIIASGFKLMTSGGNPETIARAQKKLTNAVIGFLIVISAYWLTQIAELIFGLNLTSGSTPTSTTLPACTSLSNATQNCSCSSSACFGGSPAEGSCGEVSIAVCCCRPLTTSPTAVPTPYHSPHPSPVSTPFPTSSIPIPTISITPSGPVVPTGGGIPIPPSPTGSQS